jgi:membrane fusion protein YbhG
MKRRFVVATAFVCALHACVAILAADAPEKLADTLWPAVSRAHKRVSLGSKTYENVRKVMVREGDAVKKGQVLVQYDDTTLQARINVARAEADMKAQIRNAQTRSAFLARRYRRVLRVLGSALLVPCDISDPRAFCKAALAADSPPMQRLRELISKKGLATVKAVANGQGEPDAAQVATIDKAVNDVLQREDFFDAEAFAKLTLTPETQELIDDKLGLRQPWRRQRLNRLLLEALFPKTVKGCGEAAFVSMADVEEAEFESASAQLAVEQLQRDQKVRQSRLALEQAYARDYVFTAPMDGVISQVWVESGQTVREGEQIVEMIDPDVIEVRVYLPEVHYAALKAGRQATVRFPLFDKEREFAGKVDVVAPEINATSGTFAVTVLVKLPDDDPRPKPGASCTVSF